MLYWHKEKICSLSRRRSLIAHTEIGTFRNTHQAIPSFRNRRIADEGSITRAPM
jgi:hypothetical protein